MGAPTQLEPWRRQDRRGIPASRPRSCARGRCTRPLPASAVAQQREGHAMWPAAALEDLRDLWGDDLESQSLQALVDFGVPRKREHSAVTEGLDVAVMLEDTFAGHVDELKAALPEHPQEELRHLRRSADCYARRHDVEGHVEMQVPRSELHAGNGVAERLENLLGIGDALPGRACDDAVYDRGLVEEPEVSAFEGTPGDAPDEWNAELGQLGRVAQLLALARRFPETADKYAFREAGAEVARVDHVGQIGVGIDEDDLDSSRPVGLCKLGVLACQHSQIRLRLAVRQNPPRYLVDGLE